MSIAYILAVGITAAIAVGTALTLAEAWDEAVAWWRGRSH